MAVEIAVSFIMASFPTTTTTDPDASPPPPSPALPLPALLLLPIVRSPGRALDPSLGTSWSSRCRDGTPDEDTVGVDSVDDDDDDDVNDDDVDDIGDDDDDVNG